MGNPKEAIVHAFNIQYAMKPAPWPNLRFMGTPKARFIKVNHNEMIK
jgi:hypothetical protein